MKPLQIGLLVAAGALGGALMMKWQSTRHAQPVAVASAPAVPAPAPPAAAPAEPAVPEPPAKVTPAAEPAPQKPSAARRKPVPSPRREPAVIARVEPPVEPKPAPAVAAAPQPPAPPVRTAPPAIEEPMREVAPAPAPPAEPNRVTLPSGMMIPVRLVDGLSTERNFAGDTFNATLDAPLIVDRFAIAERGAKIEGKVVESAKAGKVSGLATLAVVLTRVTTADGQHLRIDTQTFTKTGAASHRDDAAKVGAGAGIGAIIGAIAGGGKGAAIGAGVGGAAGAGGVLLTRGKPAELPSETRINFRLSAPVTVTERR